MSLPGKDISVQPLEGSGLAGTEEVTETRRLGHACDQSMVKMPRLMGLRKADAEEKAPGKLRPRSDAQRCMFPLRGMLFTHRRAGAPGQWYQRV